MRYTSWDYLLACATMCPLLQTKPFAPSRGVTMRKTVRTVIKTRLREHITRTRTQNKWTKHVMSEKLDMDDRSYADIENGTSACSAVTFILYLLFVLDDREQLELLRELREEIMKNWGSVA